MKRSRKRNCHQDLISFTINGGSCIDREAARLSIYGNTLNEVKEAELKGLRHVEIKSAIREWSENRVGKFLTPPFRPEIPGKINDVPLAIRLEEITTSVNNSDVFLLEAPTGAGKSVIIPTVMEYIARLEEHRRPSLFTSSKIGSNWKVIHVTPTGEQAVQNMEWVSEQYKGRLGRIKFGVCTSAIGNQNGKRRKSTPITANYIYATTFFGIQALNGILHAVVIDDVHELTPDTIKLLCLVRREISRGNQDRKIFKLILLSATLSHSTRQMILDYFNQIDGITVNHVSMGEIPYENHLMLTNDGRLMRTALKGKRESELYEDEVDEYGNPNIVELTSRSVAVQETILEETAFLFPVNPPGMISFHPGKVEVGKARAKLVKSDAFFDLSRSEIKVKVFKVTGTDRSNLEVLKEYTPGDPMQVINSTPLLSYGVTLPGIYFVIDDGTRKLPGKYSRTGMIEMIVRFEDRSMLMQKRGRVSRISAGAFLLVVSRRRYAEIMESDHCLEKLNLSYRTNHLPFLIENASSLMVCPDDVTFNELRKECGNTGMFHKGAWGPTEYAKLLGNTFNGLSLSLCDFVIRCCAFGIGLHGVVFAASCCTEHRAIRRATSEGAGREDEHLPMNRWPIMTGDVSHTDIEQVTEMALNLILVRPASNLIPSTCRKVGFPFTEEIEDKDAVDDLFRRVVSIFSSLRALGYAPNGLQLFFNELQDNYDYTVNKYDRGRTASIFRLKRRQSAYFNACLLASLGSRVLYEACNKDQDSYGNRRKFVLAGDEPDRMSELVQGERAWHNVKRLAIYDVVVRRASHENFLTGMLHYVSKVDFAMYGNSIGSTGDEVDRDTRTLKIKTNTAPVFVQFKDESTLDSVIRIREIMRAVSMASIIRKDGYDEFMKEVKKMVVNLHEEPPAQSTWDLGTVDGNNFSPEGFTTASRQYGSPIPTKRKKRM